MFLAFFVIKLFEIVIVITDTAMDTPNNIIGVIIRKFLNLCLFIVIQIINILIMINSRQNEFNADDFAFQNGYGADLLEGLYLLKEISLGTSISLLERLKSSHPNIIDRISRLEEKLEEV